MSDDPAEYINITVKLFAAEVERLDKWISSSPIPCPSRAEAVREILELCLGDGKKIEDLKAQISHADRAIREQFVRVFGILDEMAEAKPQEPPHYRRLN